MERGEVRWFTFAKPDKRRPVLILTRSSAIAYLNSVTVAPITSTIRDVPSQVTLNEHDGMMRPCAINLHNLQTVSQEKIGSWITSLTAEKMGLVEEALQFSLGISSKG